MPGTRHKILGHVFSGFCTKMNRTKQLSSADENMETPLKRCLNTFDITLLGKLNTEFTSVLTSSSSLKCFHPSDDSSDDKGAITWDKVRATRWIIRNF
ncbi:hypothetical protein J6590_012566 [Homalodisca vitripennis]|nr:hypothetical protein J6590_012566 [Homalodisca vitripennis]